MGRFPGKCVCLLVIGIVGDIVGMGKGWIKCACVVVVDNTRVDTGVLKSRPD